MEVILINPEDRSRDAVNLSIQRLKLAIKVLQRVRRRELRKKQPLLNMNTWVTSYDLTTKTHCGTVACVAGHLAISKEFNDIGLMLEVSEFSIDETIVIYHPVVIAGQLTFKNRLAVVNILGLTREEGYDLMFGVRYLTTGKVDNNRTIAQTINMLKLFIDEREVFLSTKAKDEM